MSSSSSTNTTISLSTSIIVLVLSSQSHAHRLSLYFSSRSTLRSSLFPSTIFTSTTIGYEAGGTSNQRGRALFVIEGIQVKAKVVLDWIERSFFGKYIQGFNFFPFNNPSYTTNPTTTTNPTSGTCSNIVAQFVCTKTLLSFISQLKQPTGCKGTRLQCSPSSLQAEIGEILSSKQWTLCPTGFEQVLSVVDVSGGDDVERKFLLSIVPALDHVMSHERRQTGSIRENEAAPCKAVAKLNETLTVLDLNVQNYLAIDCGASPGGWTKALIDHGCKLVYAIDPAILDSNVASLNGVVHIKCSGENAINQLKSINVQADIIVCDINQPPFRVANILLSLSQFLKPSGKILMTMKFNGCGREHEGGVDGVIAILRGKGGIVVEPGEGGVGGLCLWLFGNTTRERMLVVVKGEEEGDKKQKKMTDVDIVQEKDAVNYAPVAENERMNKYRLSRTGVGVLGAIIVSVMVMVVRRRR